MYRFIIKRLLTMIPIVLAIAFIIFAILDMTPGDPARMVLGENASQEALDAFREEKGLNKPMVVQYFNYIVKTLKGDFGTSYRSGLKVFDEIMSRFPNSLTLAFWGLLLSVLLGVPLGTISAIKQYTVIDSFSLAFALLLTSIPSFWLGLMLLLLFALRLHVLPATGVDGWRNFILPAVTLGAAATANLTRMTRSTMLEVIRQDYIRTARAKGAREGRIIFRHALRNAILPIVTVVGMNFGMLIGGTVVIESVFAIPGLGSLLITSVRMKDIPTVTASVMFAAIFIGLANLVTDILYAFIDPRVKMQYMKTK
jgi:peptide/nickel transport system permease protein